MTAADKGGMGNSHYETVDSSAPADSTQGDFSIGAQLLIWDKDLPARLAEICMFCKQVGYEFIEVPKMILGLAAPDVNLIVRDSGICLHAVHVGVGDVADESKCSEMIDYVLAAGAPTLISSGISGGYSVNAYEESARVLNRVGEQCDKSHIAFYYHTQWWEYRTSEIGLRGIDKLLAGTERSLVHFNLDVGWAQAGGQSPVEAVGILGDRCDYYHLKDGVLGESPNDVTWRPLGKGEVDIEPCVKTLVERGHNPRLVIEQDDPYCTPEDDMKESYGFLRKCISSAQRREPR